MKSTDWSELKSWLDKTENNRINRCIFASLVLIATYTIIFVDKLSISQYKYYCNAGVV